MEMVHEKGDLKHKLENDPIFMRLVDREYVTEKTTDQIKSYLQKLESSKWIQR
mgnify:CR=1 FL=1